VAPISRDLSGLLVGVWQCAVAIRPIRLPTGCSVLVAAEADVPNHRGEPGSSGSRLFLRPNTERYSRSRGCEGNLLAGLSEAGLLAAPTLEAFREAGFAFDHAIRCQLPMRVISVERDLATVYESAKAEVADHLKPLIDAAPTPKVLAMAYLARNAVVMPYANVPRDRGSITNEPFPGRLPECPRCSAPATCPTSTLTRSCA